MFFFYNEKVHPPVQRNWKKVKLRTQYQQEIKNFIKNIVKLYAKSIEKDEKIVLENLTAFQYKSSIEKIPNDFKAFEITDKIVKIILLTL